MTNVSLPDQPSSDGRCCLLPSLPTLTYRLTSQHSLSFHPDTLTPSLRLSPPRCLRVSRLTQAPPALERFPPLFELPPIPPLSSSLLRSCHYCAPVPNCLFSALPSACFTPCMGHAPHRCHLPNRFNPPTPPPIQWAPPGAGVLTPSLHPSLLSISDSSSSKGPGT